MRPGWIVGQDVPLPGAKDRLQLKLGNHGLGQLLGGALYFASEVCELLEEKRAIVSRSLVEQRRQVIEALAKLAEIFSEATDGCCGVVGRGPVVEVIEGHRGQPSLPAPWPSWRCPSRPR